LEKEITSKLSEAIQQQALQKHFILLVLYFLKERSMILRNQ